MPEALVILLIIFGSLFLAALAVQVFFLLSLSRALGLCQPHNRTMEPAAVWLNLLPVFNCVWMFITVIKLSETLRYEFRERGRHRGPDDYGHGLGIAMCLSWLAGLLPFIVLTIVYWVKIAEYARRLEADRGWYGDYDEDDRPRRRPRRRERDEYDGSDARPWDRGGR